MYVIYRSRFQPEFTSGHKQAVEKFFDVKRDAQRTDIQLVLGIVDEYLFTNLYDRKLLQNADPYLLKTFGDSIKAYKGRFQEDINPTNIGSIKKSIWRYWHEAGSTTKIPYTLMCMVPWTGLSLYENLAESQYVLRWLPETTPKEIGWYFPIFDKDDISDMGSIAALMDRHFGDRNSDKQRVFFARFNYFKNADNIHHFEGRRYGFYLAEIARRINLQKTKKEFFLETTMKSSCEGFEVPEHAKIPFIYLWSEAVDILDKIRDLFNWYRQTVPSTAEGSAQKVDQIIGSHIKRLKDRILDTKSFYASDLEEFFPALASLCSELRRYGFQDGFIKDVEKVVNKVTQTHSDNNGNWLETNVDSNKRMEQINAEFSKIMKGTQ